MSNLNKLDFIAFKTSRRNYLNWVQDVKLHLKSKNLCPAIEDEMDNPVGEAKKDTIIIFIRRHNHNAVQTIIFIRRHNHNAVQTEYLVEEDP
ncbi:hypothetical protein ACFX1X_028054 [Malus domestica]